MSQQYCPQDFLNETILKAEKLLGEKLPIETFFSVKSRGRKTTRLGYVKTIRLGSSIFKFELHLNEDLFAYEEYKTVIIHEVAHILADKFNEKNPKKSYTSHGNLFKKCFINLGGNFLEARASLKSSHPIINIMLKLREES